MSLLDYRRPLVVWVELLRFIQTMHMFFLATLMNSQNMSAVGYRLADKKAFD